MYHYHHLTEASNGLKGHNDIPLRSSPNEIICNGQVIGDHPPERLAPDRSLQGHASVARLSGGHLVKWGPEVTIAEGQALLFLSLQCVKKKPIPYPKIYGWMTRGNTAKNRQVYLYMERLPGFTLRRAIHQVVRDKQLGVICRELTDILKAFHSVAPPRSKAPPSHIPHEDAAHSFYCHVYPFTGVSFWGDSFTESVKSHILSGETKYDPRRPYVLTHGDPVADNIMVVRTHGSWHVSGILDFENCGWYPEGHDQPFFDLLKAETFGTPFLEEKEIPLED